MPLSTASRNCHLDAVLSVALLLNPPSRRTFSWEARTGYTIRGTRQSRAVSRGRFSAVSGSEPKRRGPCGCVFTSLNRCVGEGRGEGSTRRPVSVHLVSIVAEKLVFSSRTGT